MFLTPPGQGDRYKKIPTHAVSTQDKVEQVFLYLEQLLAREVGTTSEKNSQLGKSRFGNLLDLRFPRQI